MLEFLWFYTGLLAFATNKNAVHRKELKESRSRKPNRYTAQSYKYKRGQTKSQ